MDSNNNNNSDSNPKIYYSPSRSIPQHSGHGIMSPASNSSANHNNSGTNDSSDGIQKLLAERMATGGGALCNDPNGLCLGYEGSIDASKSGIYTSIAKLAGMLSSSSSSSSSNNNSSKNNNAKKGNNEVPMVSIQTERASLLVKEYGGRTIVFRVPNADEEMMDSNSGGGAEGGGNGEGDLIMSSNSAAAATNNSTGDVGGDS